MKEHALFLKAGFTPVNTSFAKETEFYKQEFEKLLCHAIRLSDGIVGRDVPCSGEIMTKFTSTETLLRGRIACAAEKTAASVQSSADR